MIVESLASARVARARLLSQHLIVCPVCGGPSAVHVDRSADGAPVVVRVVCAEPCSVEASAVLAAVGATDPTPLAGAG